MNLGQDESQILKNFRHFTKSHIDQFLAERDRIFDLLGPSQRYPSGVFREGLMREFLEKILPSSVSVNSGFIYGFEVESNSKQLDIVFGRSGQGSAGRYFQTRLWSAWRS